VELRGLIKASDRGPGDAPKWGPPKPQTIASTVTLSTRSSRLAREGEPSGNDDADRFEQGNACSSCDSGMAGKRFSDHYEGVKIGLHGRC